jgi:hypothetical protein
MAIAEHTETEPVRVALFLDSEERSVSDLLCAVHGVTSALHDSSMFEDLSEPVCGLVVALRQLTDDLAGMYNDLPPALDTAIVQAINAWNAERAHFEPEPPAPEQPAKSMLEHLEDFKQRAETAITREKQKALAVQAVRVIKARDDVRDAWSIAKGTEIPAFPLATLFNEIEAMRGLLPPDLSEPEHEC